MVSDKQSKLFSLQKKYIQVETKLMFERDRGTRFQLSKQLKELSEQRREITHPKKVAR